MHDLCRRVYSPSGLSPTIPTMGGGHQDPKIIEPIAYDEQNGYLRQDGCVGTLTTDGSSPKHNNRIVEPASDYRFYQQAIETLCENECEEGDTIDAYNKRVNKDGVSPALTTRPDGFKTAILPVVSDKEQMGVWNDDLGCFVNPQTGEIIVDTYEGPKPQKPNYRIRKLTPSECFRLMGVRGEDFEKVRYGASLPKGSFEKIAKRTMTKDEWRSCWRIMRHERQSVSSCYHLAGDSIVTTCLMAIFGELLSIDYNTKINELTEGIRDAD